MSRLAVIVLCVALLAGMTVAAVLWENHAYTVDVDWNFKAIALAISAIAISVAAGMFLWRLFGRQR